MARRRGQMTGNLVEKSGKWMLRWWEDFRAEDGRIVRKRVGRVIARSEGKGAVTKPQAQRIAQQEILLKLDAFTIRPQSLMTVEEFYRQKFKPKYLMVACSPGRQEHFETLMDKHILPVIGKLTLREVNTEVVHNLLASMAASTWTRMIKLDAETKVKSEPRRYSTQTVTHVKNAISALFRFARSMEHFHGQLPTEDVHVGKRHGPIRRTKRRPLTRDQVRDLLERLDSPYREMVLMVSTMGLRIGELCGLRWRDIDFKCAVMEVTDGYDPKHGYKPTKTAESDRIMPIPASLLPRLKLINDASKWKGPDDPVFVSKKGTPINRRNAQMRHIGKVGKEMGLTGVCFHSLRHSLGSMAHAAGADSTQRKQILGHGTDRMMDHYTVADIDKMRPILDRIAEDLLTPVIPDGRIQ